MAIGGVTVSVEWGYEEHSITLTAEDWARVKSGEELSIEGDGYHYEGEFFSDYWEFAGGMEGDLIVSYGNDGDYSGTGFDGKLRDASITELVENTERPTPPKAAPSPEERKRQCFQNLLKMTLPMAPDSDLG